MRHFKALQLQIEHVMDLTFKLLITSGKIDAR